MILSSLSESSERYARPVHKPLYRYSRKPPDLCCRHQPIYSNLLAGKDDIGKRWYFKLFCHSRPMTAIRRRQLRSRLWRSNSSRAYFAWIFCCSRRLHRPARWPMLRGGRRDVYDRTKARDVPGKAQRVKTLQEVVSDSSDCRAGLSDNLRVSS